MKLDLLAAVRSVTKPVESMSRVMDTISSMRDLCSAMETHAIHCTHDGLCPGEVLLGELLVYYMQDLNLLTTSMAIGLRELHDVDVLPWVASARDYTMACARATGILESSFGPEIEKEATWDLH